MGLPLRSSGWKTSSRPPKPSSSPAALLLLLPLLPLPPPKPQPRPPPPRRAVPNAAASPALLSSHPGSPLPPPACTSSATTLRRPRPSFPQTRTPPEEEEGSSPRSTSWPKPRLASPGARARPSTAARSSTVRQTRTRMTEGVPRVCRGGLGRGSWRTFPRGEVQGPRKGLGRGRSA